MTSRKSIFLPIAMLILLHAEIISQGKPSALTQSEIDECTMAVRADSIVARWLKSEANALRVYQVFKSDLRTSDSLWGEDQEHMRPFTDLGSTRKFEMLPLIDWFTGNDSLIGESGVAYLIRTDDATILFDVGLNRHGTDPSPLLKNMKRLGVRLEDIDGIVISHPHSDHIGGSDWEEKNTFSLTSHQLDLSQKRVFTPIPMAYPGLKPVYSRQPAKIAKGVATTGVIACPLFFGKTVEQALAVNVEQKGIVIISGCGHQSIEKLLQRTKRLFTEPIYGMLGGFHLPLTEGRNIGPYYKYSITGRLPWKPLKTEDIADLVSLVKRNGVRIVGISGHDTCDSTIAMFRNAYGDSYVDIAVGKRIAIE